MEFDNCQGRFGFLSSSKKDSKYLDLHLKVFRKVNKRFRTGPKPRNWKKQISTSPCDWVICWSMQQRTLVGEKTCSRVLPEVCEDMHGQLMLAHKLVEVVDRANRTIGVTLSWYSADKAESPYAQVQSFARRTEEVKFEKNCLFEKKT